MADRILEEIALAIPRLPRAPVLATVLVGGDARDRRYIKLKEDACRRVGMQWRGIFLPESVTQDELEAACRVEADGVFVQLPLPAGLSMPDLEKDVDTACTAQGALMVLREAGVDMASYTVRGDRHYAARDIGRLLAAEGAVPGEAVVVLATGAPVTDLPAGSSVVDLTGDLIGPHQGFVIPPRGVLGPLTIALLLRNTLDALRASDWSD